MIVVNRVVLAVAVASLGASALYSARDDVVSVDGAKDFRDKVIKSSSVSIVEFYAPWCGHCKNAAPEVKKAAKLLKGVANVVAVDATAKENERLAAEHGVQGFPTFLVFDGSGASKGKPYNGGRQAKDIAQAAVQAVSRVVKSRLGGGSKPSGKSSKSGSGSTGGKNRRRASEPGGGKSVVQLTDSNFDELVMQSEEQWMVEFYAPWCGHCKNLAPEWAQLAEDVDGEVMVGAVDATQAQALAQRFGVRGYPTIKMFPAGAKSSDGSAQDYNGPREAASMAQWALQQLERAGGGGGAPVAELLSDNDLRTRCKGKKICIVAFLPHILDDGKDGREKSLAMLEASAKASRGSPIRFLWTSVGQHPELESALGVSMYPAAAAVNLAKSAGALHVGTFDERGISSFVSGVLTGRARTSKATIPTLKTVQAWDGQDGSAPAGAGDEEEDDFDLQAFLNDEN